MGAEGTDIKILVLPDDSFAHSLPGSTSISDYIETAIKEEFSKFHYDVKGKAQLSGHPELRQHFSAGLSTGELITIAERVKAVKDANLNAVRALVVYKAFPDPEWNERTGSSLVVEISGEVHDLVAHRFIGKFGPIKSRTVPIPESCVKRDQEGKSRCVSAIAREESADLAMTISQEARVKLALLTKPGFGQAAPPPVQPSQPAVAPQGDAQLTRPPVRSGGLITSYTMRFENLTMPEVLKIKGVMESEFPDYIRVEGYSGNPPLVTFGYVSKAPQDKILEWMYILLSDMGLRDPVVNIRASGSKFVIQRLGSDLPPPPPAAAGGRFR